MSDNSLMIGIGVLLIVAGLFAGTVSYGMPPHVNKAKQDVSRNLRIVLLVLGLLSFVIGLLRQFNAR